MVSGCARQRVAFGNRLSPSIPSRGIGFVLISGAFSDDLAAFFHAARSPLPSRAPSLSSSLSWTTLLDVGWWMRDSTRPGMGERRAAGWIAEMGGGSIRRLRSVAALVTGENLRPTPHNGEPSDAKDLTRTEPGPLRAHIYGSDPPTPQADRVPGQLESLLAHPPRAIEGQTRRRHPVT